MYIFKLLIETPQLTANENQFFDAFDGLDPLRMPSIFTKTAFCKIANEPNVVGIEAIQNVRIPYPHH
jgi:hypothetical protein